LEKDFDWADFVRQLENKLRLRTFPICLKFIEKVEEMEKIEKIRRFKNSRRYLCQLFSLARMYGWTIGATADELGVTCAYITGLREDYHPTLLDGYARIWFKNKEEGIKKIETMPRIPPGKYEALVVTPLTLKKVEPDIIMFYGTPAQIQFAINAFQWEKYERFEFFSVGESSCADVIAQAYLTKKPAVTIPCFGERRYGGALEDEMVVAFPPSYAEKLLRGLEGLYRAGIRYPIPLFGALADTFVALPESYKKAYEKLKK